VNVGVFKGNCQTETGATGGSFACRVGSPKAVEDSVHLSPAHPNSEVGNGHGNRRFGLTNLDLDWLTGTVFDCIRNQVSKHALDSPAVKIG
jgi:hypothetical protein